MAAHADQHLLFGLLALQNGLIDQGALVAAFQAWTRDKARALADHLVDRGDLDDDQRGVIDAMVRLHLKKHGDPESSLAAVNAPSSVVSGLAGLGDADVEATLGHVPGSGSSPTMPDGAPDAPATVSMGGVTSDGQRFRVLRPHARGGLGAVFVALDAELNREVALKQILDHHADDANSRTRFVIEAEITGGLEHPGIVPVYGLGSYGDGRPYYAMRFIRGDSLKDAIAAFHADSTLKADPGKRSLAVRKLLRRFVDVCNAIEYAHSRGVLHRDIKPANVVLGKHGETLVVDWGLAKPMGRPDSTSDAAERTLVPSSASGSAETLPGSALGTPAYMSPEQAAGDLEHLGPRSDVYSLGATLYCALTGRPAFEGDDLGAILHAVQKGAFTPPRSLDPTIDRALEAVCLKAMATKPDGRYATARAMADEVERWAADEPVTAWEEPLGRRSRRWMRRNRTAVTGAAVALMMAVVGLTAVLAVQSRANADLTTANMRLESSNRREVKANADLKAANGRERARFELAQEAIRTFYTGVSEDLLLKQKEFEALRTKLLRGAREFYQRLEGLLEGQNDPASRLALGRAYRDVAELTSLIGSHEEALAVHRRALGLFEEVDREVPDEPGPRLEIGRSCNFICGLLSATARRADALACVDRGRMVLRSLADAGVADERGMGELAEAEHLYGALITGAGSSEQLGAYERARTILEALVTAHPSAERFRLELASTYDSLGLALQDAGRLREVDAAFDRARQLCEGLLAANPNDPKFAHELARTVGNWSVNVPQDGTNTAVTRSLERAFRMLSEVGEANPTNQVVQADLAWIGTLLGRRLADAGRAIEAMTAYERAVSLREKLSKANPTTTRHIEQQIYLHRVIGELHEKVGRRPEAIASYGKAREIGKKAAVSIANAPTIVDELTYIYQSWGDLLLRAGDTSGALATYELMRTTIDRNVIAHPSVPGYRSRLADCIRRIGTVLQSTGRPGEAIARYRESIAELERIEKPSAIDVYDVACCRSLISGVAGETGSGLTAAEGRSEAEQAVAGVRRASYAGYRNFSWIREGDTDLKPIRSRPDFQQLMLDLAFPADPFKR
jgi:serine/threonine protein kinase